MSKPSTSSSVADPRPVSDPTKSIVRCCELRKRRLGQTPFASDRQRGSANSSN
jgi:hypothetical protein